MRRDRWSVVLEEPDLELLLVRFLNDLVYLRDAQELLLHPQHVEIVSDGSVELRAELAGERIDRRRHALASSRRPSFTSCALRRLRTAGRPRSTSDGRAGHSR
jgi:hypothetical protein